jgi:hypothetical protein
MRSSMALQSRCLENSFEIQNEFLSEFQSDKQLISPIPLWSPRWHEATKLIYDYHMKSSWGVLPGCCYYAQRSICVPSAALWSFLHKIFQKLNWSCCQNLWKSAVHFLLFKAQIIDCLIWIFLRFVQKLSSLRIGTRNLNYVRSREIMPFTYLQNLSCLDL